MRNIEDLFFLTEEELANLWKEGERDVAVNLLLCRLYDLSISSADSPSNVAEN
jgi:hypothetical protein